MPWDIQRNHPDCDAGESWAVVKEADESLEGCHSTRDSAVEQIQALNAVEASEGESMDEIAELLRDTARTPTFSGTESGEWSAPTLEDFKAGLDLPNDAQWSDLTQDQRQEVVAHTLLGEAGTDTFNEAVVLPVVNPRTGQLNENGLLGANSRAPTIDGIASDTAESAQRIARQLLNDEFDRDLDVEAMSLAYVDLSQLARTGRPFDALMPGQFTDMHGRDVEITPTDLTQIAENTRALIEGKRTESGEVVGLPIDEKSHDKGDAAGWIVDVKLQDNVLRVVPKWTELGIEKISKGIQRMFSATIDLTNKVIVGGTLTNWPAVDGLRPIELSEGIYRLQSDESLDARLDAIRSAWFDQQGHPEVQEVPHPLEVFDDHVIVQRGDAMFRVPFTEGDDGIEFADKEEWSEVRRAFVDATLPGAQRVVRDTWKSIVRLFASGGDEDESKDGRTKKDDELESEVLEMEITKEELQETINELVDGQLAKRLNDLQETDGGNGDGGNETTAAGPQVNLLELLEIEGAGDEIIEAAQSELLKQQEMWKRQAAQKVAAMTAQIQRETRMAELAADLTAGTEDAPRAFRGVTDEDLKEALLALPKEQAPFWIKLLSTTQENGLAEFEELGHSRTVQGTTPVPDEFKPQIDQWVEAGKDARTWFELNADLVGDPQQFDLSEWEDTNG